MLGTTSLTTRHSATSTFSKTEYGPTGLLIFIDILRHVVTMIGRKVHPVDEEFYLI